MGLHHSLDIADEEGLPDTVCSIVDRDFNGMVLVTGMDFNKGSTDACRAVGRDGKGAAVPPTAVMSSERALRKSAPRAMGVMT